MSIDSAPLDWLLLMLQKVMTGVATSDATPLQKANAVARLGSLYLKAYGAIEIAQANKALKRRLAELEKRLAAAESRVPEPTAVAASRAAHDVPTAPLLKATGAVVERPSAGHGRPAPAARRAAPPLIPSLPPFPKDHTTSEDMLSATISFGDLIRAGSTTNRAPP